MGAAMTMHVKNHWVQVMGLLLLGGCALAKNADTGADVADDCEIRSVPVYFDSGELIPDVDGTIVDLYIANQNADCPVPLEDWYVTCPATPATSELPSIPATDTFTSVNLEADSVTKVSARLEMLLDPGMSYGCVIFYQDAVADNLTLVAP